MFVGFLIVNFKFPNCFMKSNGAIEGTTNHMASLHYFEFSFNLIQRKDILTGAQFAPAIKQVISPPSFLAAVIAFSVIGVNVLSSWSTTTKVDASLEVTTGLRIFICVGEKKSVDY